MLILRPWAFIPLGFPARDGTAIQLPFKATTFHTWSKYAARKPNKFVNSEMDLPQNLISAVESCRKHVVDSPLHWLPLGHREFIYHFMGDSDDEELGIQRQCCLSILTAQSLIPVYKQVFERDDLPEVVLEFARELLLRGPDSGMPTHRPDLLDRAFRDLRKEFPQRQHAISIGYSTVAALRQVIRGERFAFGEPDHSLLDEDLEPELRDAAFYAESAAGKGPYWWDDSDPAGRLAFWQNWLEVCVPHAYQLNWNFQPTEMQE